MERRFKVILEWDGEGKAYHVSVPALPGCFTYGSTRGEALTRVQEAIRGHIKGLMAIGEPVPGNDIEIGYFAYEIPSIDELHLQELEVYEDYADKRSCRRQFGRNRTKPFIRC